MRTILFLMFVLLMSPANSTGTIKLSGSLAAELRLFPEDPQFADQFDTVQPALILNPEFHYRSEDGYHAFRLVPFYRQDGQDHRRTHFDLREAYWMTVWRDWEFRIGIDRVFWGVTESRHLVDIINQTDFVEDIDNEDKLGQPMLHAGYWQDWGWLGLYVMPGFRERTFPGKEGRLRYAQPTESNARYDGNASRYHVDVALRYAQVFGDWDVGAYYFRGIGREPRFEMNSSAMQLMPVYDIVNQLGTDLQYTQGAWLWKFEGIIREGQSNTFGALVTGFEYTFYQLRNSAADLGLLFEYLYDGQGDDPADGLATIFDDDVFFGARLVLNDVQDSELLVGTIIDLQDGSSLMSVEAKRRLTNHWHAELEGRFFENADENDVLNAFDKDGFVTFRLSYFF